MNKKVNQKSKPEKKSTKIDVYSLKGTKIEQISLSVAIFGVKENKGLIAQSIRVYLSNQRRSKAKAKERGEISGSTKKIWRQKGTGRARHGDRYAPIFVGGGVTHGPRGDQNWSLSMPKKMKRKAFFSLLSSKLREGKIIAVEDLGKIEPKTKNAVVLLGKVLKSKNPKVLMVVDKEKTENIFRSFRNLPKTKISFFDQLNTHLVLNHEWLIFEKKALDLFEKRLLKNGAS